MKLKSERCPECRGSGIFERDPSGAFTLPCPVCDGCGSIGPYCKVCDAEMECVDCWSCHGEGGWHDCGEDCCPCLDKEEITVDCDECDGEGSYWQCPNVPHERAS